MARTIRDAKIETRAARDRLKPGRKPHFKTLVPGKLHLGYRRRHKELPGQWLVRHYVGAERYRIAPLGLADDFQDAADGNDVLTFADAQRMAHEHRAERRRPGKGMTVADAMGEYIQYLGQERKAAAAEAERTTASLILPRLGKIKLAELTTEDIENWRDALAKQPARLRTKPGEPQQFKPLPATEQAQRARRATVNRVLTVLKAGLNLAFRKKKVQDDLAWRHAVPFEKVNSARPGFLTIPECKRLINAADRDSGFRDLVRAALLTGCRYGELRALDVRDFQHGKIHIRESKTGMSRNVALTSEGVAFFEQVTGGRAGSDVMLPNQGRVARVLERSDRADVKIEDDGRWLKSEQFRLMGGACEAAKIKPAIGFHQLRHTYASLSVMAEMPLMVLARNLGHVNTMMVDRNYGHLREDYIDKAVRASAPTFGFRPDKKIAALPR